MTHKEWLKEINKTYYTDAYLWEIFWQTFWNFPDSKKCDFTYKFLMGMALSK